MLLWSRRLGEGERGVACTILRSSLNGGKLLSLEVVLGSKGAGLVSKAGLSVTIEGASTVAIAAAAVQITAPIASILCVCAKFTWSVVKPSTIIPIPKTAKVTPSGGIPIPVVTTSASP